MESQKIRQVPKTKNIHEIKYSAEGLIIISHYVDRPYYLSMFYTEDTLLFKNAPR
jgi:hypothetical protein